MPEGERLQKALAAAGLGSRRRCEELIAAGRVKVNGRAAELGERVDISRDRVEVDGVHIDLEVEKRYFLLNKPAGFITTVKDTRGRATVMELVKEEGRLFPVGRLDRDTRGLLLLTNDGYLAHRLLHPGFGVEKTYVVTAKGRLTARGLSSLRRGVMLEDGKTGAARVKVLEQDAKGCRLEMTIHEGRKRQVRRMCAAVGLEVTDLIRTRFGPLDLRGVGEGRYRPLSPAEVASLLGDDAGS